MQTADTCSLLEGMSEGYISLGGLTRLGVTFTDTIPRNVNSTRVMVSNNKNQKNLVAVHSNFTIEYTIKTNLQYARHWIQSRRTNAVILSKLRIRHLKRKQERLR